MSLPKIQRMIRSGLLITLVFHSSDLAANPSPFIISIVVIELVFSTSFEVLLKEDQAKRSYRSEVSKVLAGRRPADLVSRQKKGDSVKGELVPQLSFCERIRSVRL